ncbi:fibrillarin-like rRNA/tRNA 2'-O-methyltransferase [archaeon]|nr:fibrillarin-like rRNA/tRNA 2'-O-methyltransferase [archaeon]NCP79077.1 fibrillarin-like rRNA/tRNA 2'-O-methyltransferase [archaeon]NCP97541.1 fibrillarin-like rRNA/tRNA 2'-O-methyltransferase [archaeon]NCQ06844.1 fibrillarin-like rRNA/tRNA 2'-O-methyltransferase [archaeon]NCQ50640.1 fibrillarin-like rRNA/tRNA 2'-O-methyltransferase [archaeon]
MNKQIILKNQKIFTKNNLTEKVREWDPNRSKVAAGIKKGIMPNIKEDDKVLYLGAAEGYTISYISDILTKGKVYGIDISPYSMQKLLILAEKTENIIPILGDCNKPFEYNEIIKKKFDYIIQDIAQKNQAEILIKNSDIFLKEKGLALLSLKLSAISQKNHKKTIDDQINILRNKFRIINQKRLDPFEKNHMLILLEKK